MNQISSYYEIDKENIFTKGKNQYQNEFFFNQNRTPLRDITYLFHQEEITQVEEKILYKKTIDNLKNSIKIPNKTKTLSSKYIR